MEQYFVWYRLLLKAWMKRRSSWLLTIGMFVAIFVVSQIQLPSADNTRVGICIAETDYGEQLLNLLEGMDSVFIFDQYEDEEDLLEDVESGVLECGFLLSEDFEEMVRKERFEQSITYLCTPLTTKGAVVKETIYTAFLQLYGEFILEQIESDLYAEYDENVMQEMQERYQHYLENSQLLQMNTEIVPVKREYSGEDQSGKEPHPVHGMIGALLFFMLWIEGGRRFQNKGTSVFAALDTKRCRIFEYCSYLASLTIPAVAALVCVLIFTEHRGVIKEAGMLLFFVVTAGLWVLNVSRLLKKSNTFVAWVFTLVAVQVLICPVFVDLSAFFPALSVIRWAFPVMWYLG